MNSGGVQPDAAVKPRRRRLGRFLLFCLVVLIILAVVAPRFIVSPLLRRALVNAFLKDGAKAKIHRLRYSYFGGVEAKSVSVEWNSGLKILAGDVQTDLGISALTGAVSSGDVRVGTLSVYLPQVDLGNTTAKAGSGETRSVGGKKRERKRHCSTRKIIIDALRCDCGETWKEPVSALGVDVVLARSGSAGTGVCEFSVQSLTVGLNTLAGLEGNVSDCGGAGISVRALAKLNGTGKFSSALDMFSGDAEPEYHLDLDVSGAYPSRQVARMLRYIHPVFASLKSDHIRGSLSVKSSLVAHGKSRGDILDSISGTGTVSLTGGTLRLPRALAGMLEFSGKADIGSDGIVPVPGTAVEFAVKQGKIHNDDLRAGRAVLGMYAAGWTSTRGEIDQTLLVKALQLGGERGAALAELIEDETIPLVRISGRIGGEIKYEPCVDRALASLQKVPREQMEHLLEKLPEADRSRLLDALGEGQDEFLQVLRTMLEEAAADLASGQGGAGEIVDQASTALERSAEKTRLRRWKKRWKRALAAGTLTEYRKKCLAREDGEELEALDTWLRGKGISPDSIPSPPEPDPEKE